MRCKLFAAIHSRDTAILLFVAWIILAISGKFAGSAILSASPARFPDYHAFTGGTFADRFDHVLAGIGAACDFFRLAGAGEKNRETSGFILYFFKDML